VNLIGEHTDYNAGLALPFAIDRGVTVTAEPLDGDRIEAHALDFGETDEFALGAPERADGWRAFVRGAVAELGAAGYALRPCRLTIESDLRQGVGLSSSAAMETALCLALLAVAGEEPGDRVELAKLCSRVENDWVGAETGLLDQLASLCSEPGHAVRIDFATLAIEPVPLDLRGWSLVTLDSGAVHSIAYSGYNERRRECREACALLGIETLREAREIDTLPEPQRSRARHVITENARVDATVEALRAGDLARVGELLDEGHASLRDDYAASVPEVERTVERLKAAGAVGARMVGGGFGGAVLGLLPPGVAVPGGAIDVAPGPPAALL
jgi:galactokinase